MQFADTSQPVLAADEKLSEDFWHVLGVEPHPVAPLPDEVFLRSRPLQDLIDFLNDRAETMRRMVEDPFRYGYEPPIWKIFDALCGFPFADPPEAEIAAEADAVKRQEMREKKAWALNVRLRLLKRPDPVKVLLLNGGNRAGKSEWGGSRLIKMLTHKPKARAWALHENAAMSRDYQQPLLYKYLPAELKTEKGIRKSQAYIAYKQQTGFSEEKFVLPNGSDCVFKYYEQNIRSVEGGELDVILCDELVPASWIETLKARIATRGGWLLIGFTPVEGYTPTVKMFLDNALTVRESVAFVLPKDGQGPLPELAYRGEDPMAWLCDAGGQASIPAGREFERVPRLMRGTKKNEAVAFLHSFDNPFGNPRELWNLYSSASAEKIKMRFYGVATKATSSMFPKFRAVGTASEPVHVVPTSAIPKVGSRYHIVDPCSGRNWAMIWAIVDRAPIGSRIWIYREWPCPGKYVPGVGDMGAWAIPGDKHDGERGPAQWPLGWGLIRYRNEIRRLEGVADWEQDEVVEDKPFQFDKWDQPEVVTPRERQRRRKVAGIEDIECRRMDSRFAHNPTTTKEGQTTLLEECYKVGLEFEPASGRDIDEGTDLINSYLDYDVDQPISALNSPRLFVSEECQNVIFALQNWTGADGQKGACKDFVDLIRYLLLSEPEDYTE